MTFAINFPNISPEIFSVEALGMTFALRWYALAYVAGILIGVWLIAVMARRPAVWANRTPALQPKHAEALVTWLVLGIILGGRLGFVLIYQPGYYLTHLAEIPRVTNKRGSELAAPSRSIGMVTGLCLDRGGGVKAPSAASSFTLPV